MVSDVELLDGTLVLLIYFRKSGVVLFAQNRYNIR